MSEDDVDGKAIVVKLPFKTEVSVSERTVSRLGRVFPWLIPEVESSPDNVSGTKRVADEEAGLAAQHRRLDLERQQNVNSALARTAALLDLGLQPNRMALLPVVVADADRPIASPEWYARWLRDVEDVTSESVREIYAGLLAGEITAPSSFSLRTLSVLRDLDQRTATEFARLRTRAFNDGALPAGIMETPLGEQTRSPGIGERNVRSLQDAGLIASGEPELLRLPARIQATVRTVRIVFADATAEIRAWEWGSRPITAMRAA